MNLMDYVDIRRTAKEKADAIGKEYRWLSPEEGESFIVERAREAVRKPDPVGTLEVYHLLRIPFLSDNALMKLMEAVAETHVLEIDGYLGKEHEFVSDSVLDKALELLGKEGVLYAVHDYSIRRYGKKGENGKHMVAAVKALAERGDDESLLSLNRFAIVALETLSDDTIMDVIEALAEKECPQPLQLFATGTLYSRAVRAAAQAALGGMATPAQSMGLESIGVKVMGPRKPERPSGGRKRVLN